MTAHHEVTEIQRITRERDFWRRLVRDSIVALANDGSGGIQQVLNWLIDGPSTTEIDRILNVHPMYCRELRDDVQESLIFPKLSPLELRMAAIAVVSILQAPDSEPAKRICDMCGDSEPTIRFPGKTSNKMCTRCRGRIGRTARFDIAAKGEPSKKQPHPLPTSEPANPNPVMGIPATEEKITCAACKAEKIADDFKLGPGGGRNSTCRTCSNAKMLAGRAANALQECVQCKGIKTKTEFERTASGWSVICLECKLAPQTPAPPKTITIHPTTLRTINDLDEQARNLKAAGISEKNLNLCEKAIYLHCQSHTITPMEWRRSMAEIYGIPVPHIGEMIEIARNKIEAEGARKWDSVQ